MPHKIVVYPLSYDTGVAPNPYGGVLSFACCLPHMRKTMELGDILIGVGSQRLDRKITENGQSLESTTDRRILYMAKITDIMSYESYSKMVNSSDESSPLREKIPKYSDELTVHNYGDCMYDFEGSLVVRPNLHLKGDWNDSQALEAKIRYDLGEDILLSHEFVYFGQSHVHPMSFLEDVFESYQPEIGGFFTYSMSEVQEVEVNNFIKGSDSLLGQPCLDYRVAKEQQVKEVSFEALFMQCKPLTFSPVTTSAKVNGADQSSDVDSKDKLNPKAKRPKYQIG